MLLLLRIKIHYLSSLDTYLDEVLTFKFILNYTRETFSGNGFRNIPNYSYTKFWEAT